MGANPDAQRLAELAALVDAVKERIRTQYPDSTSNGASGVVCVGLPDLTPLARARDAAAGKMAAIGTVNPRRGGVVNNFIQSVKRSVARSLNWFVRDQVIFNRQMIACIEVTIETLNDINRTIHALAGQANTELQRVRTEAEPLRREAEILRAKTSEFQDLVSHWNRWREEWQLKLHKNEVEFLTGVAELNTSFIQKFQYAEAATNQRCTQAEHRIGEVTTAFQKTAAELDASYRRIATEIEASCQAAAARPAAVFESKVAELADAFEKRTAQMENEFRRQAGDSAAALHTSTNSQVAALAEEARQAALAMDRRLIAEAQDFEKLVASSIEDLQKKFYSDLDRIRTEYERVIHAELRVVRQRLATPAPVAATTPESSPAAPAFDYTRFADRFRGSEQYVSESQQFYLPYFNGRRRVLDLGCGRGEFLRLMKESGIPAKGIEAGEESVAHCRAQGLDAEQADIFSYLAAQPEAALDGIFCSQVVEHLPPARLPEFIRLCATRLATGGVLAIETPNPECLAIFATHFYLDPTHTRPIPAQLLAFYMEESGLGRIEIHPKSPAVETMPELATLPGSFREKFFGGLDYAIIAFRL